MPEEDAGAGELQHPEEIAHVVFPAGHEAPRLMEPRKEPFDFPAASIAAKRSAILSEMLSVRAMRGNHLDAVLCAELLIERVRIVAAVANQSGREFSEEAGVERGGNEVRLIR